MKKTIGIILGSLFVIFALVAGIFKVQHHYKQLEIREAQEQKDREEAKKVYELKYCQELIGVFDGKISDSERAQLIEASGDLEKTRQVLLLLCEDRFSYWDSRILNINNDFKELERINQEAKNQGIWGAASVREAAARIRTKLGEDRELAVRQKSLSANNSEKIRTWQHNPYR